MNEELESKTDPANDEETSDQAPTDGAVLATELEARCADLEARWLRAQADLQNQRRRAQLELDSALLRTLTPLLEELFLVSDFLDMALATPVTTPEAQALAQGVAMTRTKLNQALEQADVRPIEATGVFDPSLHEAAESRPSADVAAGSIVTTLRTGYTWQGRILRPARVVVATSPESTQETT